ncbi:E3 ubiquitin-protein ligase CCNB1IP1 [Gigaspora margarita]|uniref:E3 ubiquitin-protein ligase CCNB1IP1 n=1 Tax=Gigaspora margarita TaxID=4874 RepID=A0A8H3XLD8_GIGMA|nr:E3 ubiquitin-protein ligase CCNB1IP1 [Gigaspora margarita]
MTPLTPSRIFLVDCANNAFTLALVCPACETSLTESEDIMFADLNPSEEYKSSALSGLRPDIIMEICSRALSFWTYQTTQENCFQEMLYRDLEDKYADLEKQVQVLIRESESEVNVLKAKFQTLQKDMELEKRKTHDLNEQLQEKGRQLSKLQSMYDKLKRRSLVPAIQQPINNPTGTAPVGVGSRQCGAYPSSIPLPTWNGSNGQENNIYRNQQLSQQLSQQLPIPHQDYSEEQTPFPSIPNNGNDDDDLSPTYRQTSPPRQQKSPTRQQKSPTRQQKSPTHQQKSSYTQARIPFALASTSASKIPVQNNNKGGTK